MFAIVEIAGKQHKVQAGDVLRTEKLKAHKEGEKVKLDTVLMRAEGEKVEIGTPYVSGAMVELSVKEHGKGKKVKVFKKKSKKRYERTQGHRQAYTEVEVLSVK